MKRVLSFLLIAVVLMGLMAACGGDEEATPTPEVVNVEGGLPATAIEIGAAR